MMNDIATLTYADSPASLLGLGLVDRTFGAGPRHVVLAEGISSGTMDSMNLDEVGNTATQDVPATPEWLVDYMRMIEQWAEAFDRDAVHLTQEEYDALFNDPQLAGLEGM